MSETGCIRDLRPAGELPPEEFRRLGYHVIDMMTDYFRTQLERTLDVLGISVPEYM